MRIDSARGGDAAAALTARKTLLAKGPSSWSQRRRGILEIALSGVGFGFLGLFGKAAFAAGLTPGENLSLRFLIAAALLWCYVLRFKRREALTLPRATIARCAGLGILGYAAFASLYFEALRSLSASLAVLLLYTYPVMVALGAYLFLKERPTPRTLLSLPVIVPGIGLLVVGGAGGLAAARVSGVAFGLGAALLYSFYIVISSRALRGVSALVSVTYIQTFAGLALAAIHLHDAARLVAILRVAWPLLMGMAVVSTVAPMVLFLSALQKLSAAEVSVLSTLEPVTGVALASLALGERLTPLQWLGAALVLGTVLFLATERRTPPRVVVVPAG